MWEAAADVEKSSQTVLQLGKHSLTLAQIRDVSVCGHFVDLDESAVQRIERSHGYLKKLLAGTKALYGINTGFGQLATTRIPAHDLGRLQSNLVMSHAVGVGPLLEREQVRGIMLLRANALARGQSGIRIRVVRALLDFLNADIAPSIPSQGSVGASGDLAPLAHLAFALMGGGYVLEADGSHSVAGHVLRRASLEPLVLEAKEGLALLNGTQPMLALGIEALLRGELCSRTADVIGALTLQPLMGTSAAFDDRLHQLRPFPGAQLVARNLRNLTSGSPLIESHRECDRVQDAYSLRGMPVVHGASRDAMRHVRQVLEIEANSVTDNPIIFEGEAISGANFHGQPVALPLDYLGIALAELGSISERRVNRLLHPHYNEGLPAFLTPESGVNSGLMVVQYTSAALVSENKSLAHPASVDSIPTSAGKEDHVSMGTIAARKALQIARNLENILAIELLCAAQAVDLRGAPGLSEPTTAVYELVRDHVPPLTSDRWLKPDIEKARELIVTGRVVAAAEATIGSIP